MAILKTSCDFFVLIMIHISLLNDLVQFTLSSDPNEREKEKKFLENALRQKRIFFTDTIGETQSLCDRYVHVSQFNSVDDIRDLFVPNLSSQGKKDYKKTPVFFKEPPVHYRFEEQPQAAEKHGRIHRVPADKLIENKIAKLEKKV
ncbi:hypothetical protein FOG18_10480 [Legionella israelensis]|uniref:hypothetical protein n=1 Tax=Legionella israelensis TaxID=454 RepID=UPI00117E4BBE|nr:hypothetical protein [Legionella israelensis]QDP72958.1 hypothetical protein FOG18_10480 [Legionella israelensis]